MNMKVFITSILFVIAPFFLLAQNDEFAPVGTKWYYSDLDFALRDIPHIIESVGKENYQGKLCSKLVTSDVGPLPSPTYVYSQNDTVFFYSMLTNQFEILYDFTAEVGDQWVVGGVYSRDDNGNELFADTITVDSISLLLINGVNLKVWHISHGFFYDWGKQIVENIGNLSLFAPKYAMWELQVWGLRCFETPDTIFHFVPYPCDTIYSTISATQYPEEETGITVSPNPFHEQFVVISDSQQLQFSFWLFDSTGRLIRRDQNIVGNLEVNTESLPSGIYFWRLEMGVGEHRSGKCLKL